MSDRSERALNVSLVIAASAIAVVLVHREFFSTTVSAESRTTIEYMPRWREMVPSGRLIGDSAAPVKIIEFVDLQCPYCRRFNRSIQLIMERYPSQVSVVFIHLPLRSHPFALPAARAVECAHAEGQFADLVDLLYERQDSMGGQNPDDAKVWSAYAREVGVLDTARFTRCMQDSTTPPAVEAGLKIAKEHSIRGTPTVIINGWRYSTPPSDSELVRDVGRLLAGKRLNSRSFLARVLGRG